LWGFIQSTDRAQQTCILLIREEILFKDFLNFEIVYRFHISIFRLTFSFFNFSYVLFINYSTSNLFYLLLLLLSAYHVEIPDNSTILAIIDLRPYTLFCLPTALTLHPLSPLSFFLISSLTPLIFAT
jgi:hypothetical protein